MNRKSRHVIFCVLLSIPHPWERLWPAGHTAGPSASSASSGPALPAETPHHREISPWKGRIQAGSFTQHFQTPARAEKQSNPKAKQLEQGSREQRLEIPSCTGICTQSSVQKQGGGNGFAKHTGGTAEPEQIPGTHICAAHQCSATNSTQNSDANPHFHL